MEPPATFDADALRDEKVKVIRAIGELTPDQIRSDVVRGQYGPGTGWVVLADPEGNEFCILRSLDEVHARSSD